jgi:hypothetical protein
MTSDKITALPIDVLDCGKKAALALLELEPNKRIRAVIAEQLGAFLLAHGDELKNTPIRPSQQLAAAQASRDLTRKHDMSELLAGERPTPVVEGPGIEKPVVEGAVRNRHPDRER